MAFKVGKVLTNAVMIGLLVAILVLLVQGQKSVSRFEGAPLVINPGPKVQAQPANLFAIKPSLECTPGPSEKAAYFTSGLTPGGLCGDQDLVHDQMRDFAIADGIGGSLLEK
mgnify:CR=1 FL=1